MMKDVYPYLHVRISALHHVHKKLLQHLCL